MTPLQVGKASSAGGIHIDCVFHTGTPSKAPTHPTLTLTITLTLTYVVPHTPSVITDFVCSSLTLYLIVLGDLQILILSSSGLLSFIPYPVC